MGPGPDPSSASAEVGLTVLTVMAVVGAVLLFGLLTFQLGRQSSVFTAGFTQFIFIGVSWVCLRAAGRHPLRHVGSSPVGGAIALGLGAGVLNYLGVVIPLQSLAVKVLPESWREHSFGAAELLEGRPPLEVALLAAVACLAAPVGEEYFFRGVMQRGLSRSRMRPVGALVMTAIVFSAVHGDPFGFASRLELGLLFGILYLRTGSLWPAIAAHAANNLTAFALYFAFRGMASPGASVEGVPWVSVIVPAVMFAPLLWLLLRRLPSSWRLPGPVMAPPRSLLASAAPWLLIGTLALTAHALFSEPAASLSEPDAPTNPLERAAPELLPEAAPETP